MFHGTRVKQIFLLGFFSSKINRLFSHHRLLTFALQQIKLFKTKNKFRYRITLFGESDASKALLSSPLLSLLPSLSSAWILTMVMVYIAILIFYKLNIPYTQLIFGI